MSPILSTLATLSFLLVLFYKLPCTVGSIRNENENILQFHNVNNCTFHVGNYEANSSTLSKILELNQYGQPWTITQYHEPNASNIIVDPTPEFHELCDIHIYINARHDTALSKSTTNRMTSVYLFIVLEEQALQRNYLYHSRLVPGLRAHALSQKLHGTMYIFCNTCNGQYTFLPAPKNFALFNLDYLPGGKVTLAQTRNFEKATIKIILREVSQNRIEDFRKCGDRHGIFLNYVVCTREAALFSHLGLFYNATLIIQTEEESYFANSSMFLILSSSVSDFFVAYNDWFMVPYPRYKKVWYIGIYLVLVYCARSNLK